MNERSFIIVLISFFYPTWFYSQACECPLSSLSKAECNKYEIIFKGKVLSVKDCDNKFGEALFELDELYKGNATKQFKVLFECSKQCGTRFNVGEEWVIYSRYKQLENALMDWCSRSRKYFKIDKQDFYKDSYGNDYYDEVKFLRDSLGLHRLLSDNPTRTEGRNARPGTTQFAIILICSLAVLILFYYLFNRFFK